MDKQDLPLNTEEATSAVKAAWQPLGFEKMSARDAEATFSNIGVDGGFYS